MASKSMLPALSPDGNLSRYFEQIRAFPMLEPSEEYMLAKSWKDKEDIKAARKRSRIEAEPIVKEICYACREPCAADILLFKRNKVTKELELVCSHDMARLCKCCAPTAKFFHVMQQHKSSVRATRFKPLAAAAEVAMALALATTRGEDVSSGLCLEAFTSVLTRRDCGCKGSAHHHLAARRLGEACGLGGRLGQWVACGLLRANRLCRIQ